MARMFFAALLLAAGACHAHADREAPEEIWRNPQRTVEERVSALLPTLSVEQLGTETLHLWVTQVMPVLISKYNKTGVGAAYSHRPTGNVSCDFSPPCNLAARLAAQRSIMKSSNIPITFVSETLHSPWIGGGVVFPMPVALGASWNTSLLAEVGRAIAAESWACGVSRAFSPEINVCTDPRFGRTMENLGADALHVANMGRALASGLQNGEGSANSPFEYVNEGGMSCEAKHLAAYGNGNMDGAPADVSEMTLHDVYLKPWKKFFAAGGRGAMLAHNSLNGIPMHMNKQVMTDIVRKEWNRTIFFASDYHDVDSICGFNMCSSPDEAGVLSMEAGMDQALGGNGFDNVAALVASGKLDRKSLERAARNVLREKFAAKLFDRKFDGASDGSFGNTKMCKVSAEGGVLDSAAHRALALQAAEEGTVLLKNGMMSDTGGVGCTYTNNSDCYGDGLGSGTHTPTAAACCALCAATSRCATSVWIPSNAGVVDPDEKKCLLKAKCSRPQKTGNRMLCSKAGTRTFSLPLTPAKWAKIKTVAIVGPNANNSAEILGSYSASGAPLVTVADAARSSSNVPAGVKVKFAALDPALIDTQEVCVPCPSCLPPRVCPGGVAAAGPNVTAAIAQAVAAAKAADLVIVVLGDSLNTCGEGTDRISLDLPGVQLQLLTALTEANKPMILSLVNGRPMTFGKNNAALASVDVLMSSWIGGEESGNAFWNLVNGKANPSGRLSQQWPRSVGYVRSHADSQFGPQGLRQGDYQNMGWHDGELTTPLFPFGAGLSYGQDTFSFVKRNVSASKASNAFTVEVACAVAGGAVGVANGGAVIQVYFSQHIAMAARPVISLLAFAKVQRTAAKQTVSVTVETADLGYFHPLTKQTSVDSGAYTLAVATDSASAIAALGANKEDTATLMVV